MYKHRSPEEIEMDRAEGARGTALHAMGLRAFGLREREQKRKRVKDWATAFNEKTTSNDTRDLIRRPMLPIFHICTLLIKLAAFVP